MELRNLIILILGLLGYFDVEFRHLSLKKENIYSGFSVIVVLERWICSAVCRTKFVTMTLYMIQQRQPKRIRCVSTN